MSLTFPQSLCATNGAWWWLVRSHACLFVWLFSCLLVDWLVCLFVCLLVYVFVCLFVGLFGCLFVWLGVCILVFFVLSCVCVFVFLIDCSLLLLFLLFLCLSVHLFWTKAKARKKMQGTRRVHWAAQVSIFWCIGIGKKMHIGIYFNLIFLPKQFKPRCTRIAWTRGENLRWVPPGCFLGASWAPPGCFLGA